MLEPKIPLVILGGRDRHQSALPTSESDRHALRGYKGAELEIAGRPLVCEVVDRLRAVEAFEPIHVSGPASVYAPIVPEGVRIIDTDGDFGTNLRASVDAVTRDPGPQQAAFTTCDIVPDPDELRRALRDLEAHPENDFWMPQVRVPEDPSRLGESEWKPKYRLRPHGEPASVAILPSHLVIADPRILRLRFIYRFFDLLYRTRNRPLAERRGVLTRHLLWSLVVEDIKHVFSGRPPHIFAPVVFHSLLLASKLKAGRATAADFERGIRQVFIKRGHRRRYPDRLGRVPVLDALSLAKDIDTVEEAREAARRVAAKRAAAQSPSSRSPSPRSPGS